MKLWIDQLAVFYSFLARGLSYLQAPFLLGIRLFWGYQFAVTGWGKLTHIEKVAGFFATLNIPFPHLNAYLAGLSECVGGCLILVGFFSRPAALSLTFTMLVAYLTAEQDAVREIFTAPEKFYQADPFTFLMAALLVLVFGPGWISVDGWIRRARSKHETI